MFQLSQEIQDLRPEKLSSLHRKYSAKNLDGKLENKAYLQVKLGFAESASTPLVATVPELFHGSGLTFLSDLVTGIAALHGQVVVVGDESGESGRTLQETARRYHSMIRFIPESKEAICQALAAADVFLLPAVSSSDQRGVELALVYGCVPILSSSDARRLNVSDYNPRSESGQGFVYEEGNLWSVFASLVRAFETYKLPYDFQTIQKAGMRLTA